jgi:hypothetical protein
LIALDVPVVPEKEVAVEIVPPKDSTRVTNLGNKFEKSQITNADKLEIVSQPERQLKVPSSRTGSNQANQNGRPALPGQAHVKRGVTASIRLPVPVQESSGFLASFFKIAVLAGAIGAAGFWYLGQEDHSTERNPATQPGVVAPAQGVTQSKTVPMRLRIFPDGDFSKVHATMNSSPLDLSQGSVLVPVGEPIEVVVDRPGFTGFRKDFTIKEAELKDTHEYLLDVKLEPLVFGTFTLSTIPELADVSILNLDQGQGGIGQKSSLILKTPIYQEKLPVGNYKVIIKNETLGVEKTFQIEIKEGDRLVKNGVPLEPSRNPSSQH